MSVASEAALTGVATDERVEIQITEATSKEMARRVKVECIEGLPFRVWVSRILYKEFKEM